MRFKVRHETLYRYDAPVRFAPHVLRLNPRSEGVRVVSRMLTVTPQPVERRDFVDSFGNRLTNVVFDRHADALRIESHFELDTTTPVDAASVVEGLPTLPWPDAVPDGLDGYRRETQSDASVTTFARELAAR